MIVADVMTTDVVKVRPSMPLKEVAEVLIARGISGVPVVDAEGRVLGVVSETDILAKEQGAVERAGLLHRLLSPDTRSEQAKVEATTAAEAMTSPPVTTTPHATIAEAAATMLEHCVNRLPVVDGPSLRGIVTRADLVRAFIRPDAEIAHQVQDEVLRRRLWIKPEDVQVSVERGSVRLQGHVESDKVARKVESLVRDLPGVVEVDSYLRTG
jgi:CBS domain-containing protein